MSNIWTILVFIALFIVFMRVLKSLLKGCLSTFVVVFIIWVIITFIRSTKAPVTVFNRYVVDNLKVRVLE